MSRTAQFSSSEDRQSSGAWRDGFEERIDDIPVLEIVHVRLASLVRNGIVSAPVRRDPAKMAARVLHLRIIAHGVEAEVGVAELMQPLNGRNGVDGQ